VTSARTGTRDGKGEDRVARSHGASVRRRRKLALALVVVAIVLIVIGITYRPVSYHSVDDVMKDPEAHYGRVIEVKGEVKEGSLVKGNVTLFVLKGTDREMNVTYTDNAPDGLVEGKDIVVKGSLGRDGTFRATSITVGCPSRYAPRDIEAGTGV
jgi:cytochrome c-type biogenesis protein CcmE